MQALVGVVDIKPASACFCSQKVPPLLEILDTSDSCSFRDVAGTTVFPSECYFFHSSPIIPSQLQESAYKCLSNAPTVQIHMYRDTVHARDWVLGRCLTIPHICTDDRKRFHGIQYNVYGHLENEPTATFPR
jgi:hypothetical protein